MNIWFIFRFPVAKKFQATQLQSCSNKQSQKTKCKCVRYFETRLLEKYENFQNTLWKRNNPLCRWWCRLHEDNKLDLVYVVKMLALLHCMKTNGEKTDNLHRFCPITIFIWLLYLITFTADVGLLTTIDYYDWLLFHGRISGHTETQLFWHFSVGQFATTSNHSLLSATKKWGWLQNLRSCECILRFPQ